MNPLRVLWRRRALERTGGWSRAQLERHQDQNLTALRRFAVERSPFYRRFHRRLEARPLHELPILTKAVMMEHFDELVTDRGVRLSDAEAFLRTAPANALFQGKYVVLATSGSTGRRGVFLFDPDEWLTALAMITRPMAWAGLTRGWRPPRSAMIASTTPWHYSARVTASLSTRLLPALRLDATEPIDSIVRRLNDWQPEVLAGYPSVLSHLADAQIAGDLRLRLRSVATSAEVLSDATRRRVQQAWGLRMFDTYGATEYAPIAAECAFGRKHLFEDGAIIEIVDEKGRAVAPGERGDRVLLTVFDRRTQPLIRYEISDMVRPLAGTCPCGRPYRLIESIDGRVEDVLHFSHRDDRSAPVAIHPNVFHELLETVPAAAWQVEQQGADLLVSLVAPRDSSLFVPIATTIRLRLEAAGARIGMVRVGGVDELRRGATGKAALIKADSSCATQATQATLTIARGFEASSSVCRRVRARG
jgi:putative adenylate-forming enzyme